MSILLKTERAIQRWLLGNAAYLVTGEGQYVVTDKGLKITMGDGYQFFLPVLRGQDDVEKGAPAVVVACPSARQYDRRTSTRVVDVEISLRYPADEGLNARKLLEAFEYAAEMLTGALLRTDFPEVVSTKEDGFTCQWAMEVWTEVSGWTDRFRTYAFRRPLIVMPKDM